MYNTGNHLSNYARNVFKINTTSYYHQQMKKSKCPMSQKLQFQNNLLPCS